MDAQEEFFSLEHSRLPNIAWWVKNLALVMLIINVLLAGAKSVEFQNTETYIVAGLSAAVAIAVVYFPLKALSQILGILMEMEFRSRKAN